MDRAPTFPAALQHPLASLSQHARLITLDTPLQDDALIAHRFRGREALSSLFRFDVDCLSPCALHELNSLAGGEATLRLRLADGSRRPFHGIVSSVRRLGSDGALTRYRLTLEPWLAALTLRRDCYVFHDKTVPEILDEVFRDYPNACYRFALQATLPKRSVTVQYRETDYDFIARLLAEEGLSYYFQHDDTESQGGPARHCLVVFDDNAALAPCAQQTVRRHRAEATETQDAITLWSQQRQVAANAVALGSWDYKTLTAHAAEAEARRDAADVPLLEIHEGSGAYRYTDARESTRLARARAESLALQAQAACGESAMRSFLPGAWFTLIDDAAAPADYVLLSVEHCAATNLPGQDTIEAGTYRNHFTCAPRTLPIRPPYWKPAPTASGSQVALVVGAAGEDITTERDHRVRLQFPWQRGERAAIGQLAHPATSNAPGNETAGAWVRVAEAAAGANWGSGFIARIGQEVLVDFVSGDADRGVVTGQLYNGADTPPWHGADNHAGALAGIRSREYAASGFNDWVIDDTPGQLRQALASSQAASRFHAGYLIRQQGNVRGAYRGAGFELATDAWSTVRAKQGLFVSTAQRSGAVSTQLDAQEAQGRLEAAAGLAKTLSDASARHQALPLSTSDGMQELMKTVGGSATADSQQAPAFAQPVALLDSQAGMSAATPASAVMLAGRDVTLTAAAALRVSAGQAVSVAVAQAASLFTDAGGAKVIAAKEAVSVRAHTGPLDVLAERAMTVTSSNGSVRMQAKREILLASGGGYIKLAGANIDIHCPASVSVKGITRDFLGAGSMTPKFPVLPTGSISVEPAKQSLFVNYDEQIVYKDAQAAPIAGQLLYRISSKANEQTLRGQEPRQGETDRLETSQAQDIDYAFRYKNITLKE